MRSKTQEVAQVFREESGRILATLIRGLGDFDLAEEVMQDAFTEAVRLWPEHGVPENPGAWITTVARRKGIDRIRRQRTRAFSQDSIRYAIEGSRPAGEDEMISALDPFAG
jgi:RNA polymerase sigma-70 factor (ECF subfamily)